MTRFQKMVLALLAGNLLCTFGLYLRLDSQQLLLEKETAEAAGRAKQQELEKEWGALPLAGRNLLDRARIRIRAQRLGCTSVALTSGRIVYLGVDVPRELVAKFKQRRAIVYPKQRKLAYPFHTGKEELLPAALGVLEEIGGDDEGEE